jgi:hypothetical protein
MLERPAKRPWRPAPKIVTTQTAKLFPSALMLFRAHRKPQAALLSRPGEFHPEHRVTGDGRPSPVPTERGVRISRTTLFDS